VSATCLSLSLHYVWGLGMTGNAFLPKPHMRVVHLNRPWLEETGAPAKFLAFLTDDLPYHLSTKTDEASLPRVAGDNVFS
jgi:hypothetical protein